MAKSVSFQTGLFSHNVEASAKKFFSEEDTFGSVLLVAAARLLGDPEEPLGFLQWDAETIQLELTDKLNKTPTEENFNKLMGAIRVVTSNAFYVDLHEFIAICNALFDGRFDPNVFDPAEAIEIAWGITEAVLLWPPDEKEDNPFAPDIVKYIAEVLKMEGLLQPPDVLRIGGVDYAQLNNVQAAFSDDPTMYASITQMQQQRNEEIDAIVRMRLERLITQIKTLTDKSSAPSLLSTLREQESSESVLKPV